VISEICAELRNYFLRDYVNPEHYIHYGSFVIANGEIQSLPFLKFGQFYRIVGSTFNDGVHKYSDNHHRGAEDSETLTDEEFEGTIWEMFVPKEVVDLSAEIQDWVSKNADTINSPYQSESFGGYSYTKAIASTGKLSTDWQSHFAGKLNRWRRLTVL
jgi:hypothetical protein